MDELDIVREEIRKVDRDMTALFEKRMALSREVALCKMKSGAPIYDAAREEKNIRELSALLQDAADAPYFRRWYQLLMDLSKEKQRAEKDARP